MSTLLAAASLASLVFAAPGYPGAAGDAKPLVDRFATAVAAAAGWPGGSLAAVYDPTDEGGVAKLKQADAVLAFVPYPFYVAHGAELDLKPLVQADVADVGSEQRWTLIAKSGRAAEPKSLAGYTILSVAGYAPDFVRRSALKDWTLPPDVKIAATGQVLSALRRTAAGEAVAVLLDQTQAKALATLPFAPDLSSVMQSPELPVALIAVVGSRVTAERARSLKSGLLKMGRGTGGADSLTPLGLRGFVELKLPPPASAP